MKKLLAVMFMAFVVNAVAFAQTYQEVVYLKNGSIVRGVIIEQIPRVSIKIQTTDGSIFAYQMDEVEKITKEEVVKPSKATKSPKEAKEHIPYASIGYKLKRGYRGFFDVGYSYGIDGDWSVRRVEVSTIHGYQITPYLFVGAGIGVHYCPNQPDFSIIGFGDLVIPVFANIRATLPCHSICQPFIDLNAGYSVYKCTSFYMAASVGCRLAVSGKCGINLSIGYSMQEREFEYITSTYLLEWIRVSRNKTIYSPALTFKVGFDF